MPIYNKKELDDVFKELEHEEEIEEIKSISYKGENKNLIIKIIDYVSWFFKERKLLDPAYIDKNLWCYVSFCGLVNNLKTPEAIIQIKFRFWFWFIFPFVALATIISCICDIIQLIAVLYC